MAVGRVLAWLTPKRRLMSNINSQLRPAILAATKQYLSDNIPFSARQPIIGEFFVLTACHRGASRRKLNEARRIEVSLNTICQNMCKYDNLLLFPTWQSDDFFNMAVSPQTYSYKPELPQCLLYHTKWKFECCKYIFDNIHVISGQFMEVLQSKRLQC